MWGVRRNDGVSFLGGLSFCSVPFEFEAFSSSLICILYKMEKEEKLCMHLIIRLCVYIINIKIKI